MSRAIPVDFRALPLSISQLSLAAVLKCGQSFRWSNHVLSRTEKLQLIEEHPTHEYRLCLKDRVVCLRQSPDTLFYRAIFPEGPEAVAESSLLAQKRELETLVFITDYFQLETDLLRLYDEWSDRDPVFGRLRHRFEGIRMLRQDPWENIVSFICSSNNNIPRITKMIQSLCTHFSPPLLRAALPTTSQEPNDSTTDFNYTQTYHAFPPPSVLADPSVSATLRTLGFGYRAEYIQRTAEMLMEKHLSDEEAMKWLQTLRAMSTEDARIQLLNFVGVGRKVADCILLMSLDKTEVVPVDTHVHQIAMKHYGVRSSPGAKVSMTPKLYEEVNAKLTGIWGPFAGWAHSVLFTADLRSFSNYGLLTPSPSPEKKRTAKSSKAKLVDASPSPMRKKRVLEQAVSEIASVLLDDHLADRVKKRRRVATRRDPLQS